MTGWNLLTHYGIISACSSTKMDIMKSQQWITPYVLREWGSILSLLFILAKLRWVAQFHCSKYICTELLTIHKEKAKAFSLVCWNERRAICDVWSACTLKIKMAVIQSFSWSCGCYEAAQTLWASNSAFRLLTWFKLNKSNFSHLKKSHLNKSKPL